MTWGLAPVSGVLVAAWMLVALLLLPAARRRLVAASALPQAQGQGGVFTVSPSGDVYTGGVSGKATNEKTTPRWAAVVLSLETLQLIGAVAAISALVTWTCAWALTLGSGTSAAAVAHTISRIQGFEHFVNETRLALWVWALAVGTIALVYWISRRRRAQFANARAALISDKFERLVEQFNKGELPPLPPSAEMQPEVARLQELDGEIAGLVQQLEAAENDRARDQIKIRAQPLLDERRAMLERVVRMDLMRRIEVPPYDPDLVGMPPPARSLRQKVGRVFVSRGMFRHLGLGQRALLVANVLLAVPSLLTLTGAALSADFEAKIARLDQIRVGFEASEPEARFAAALEAPPPSPEPADAVDDETFANIANAHAMAFEGAIARGLEERLHLAPVGESVPRAENAMRQHNARKRISRGGRGPHQSASERSGRGNEFWAAIRPPGRGAWRPASR